MKRKLNILLAQLNWIVGDIENNCERMLKIFKAYTKYTDIIMFSELSLTGYPAEDLIFRMDFKNRCLTQLKRLQTISNNKTAIIVGHPWYEKKNIYNVLSFFFQGKLLIRYFKQKLLNYGVFDELRYFSTKQTYCVVNFKNYRIGTIISEDICYNKCIDVLKNKKTELLLTTNALPFSLHKEHYLDKLLINCCKNINAPVIYLNQVGGQDELVFDGNSKIITNNGKQIYNFARFKEQIDTISFNNLSLIKKFQKIKKTSTIANIYQALVMATKDYFNKNKFEKIILGLSGGIDSGITTTIAVDAVGQDRVQAVMMPFRYTTEASINNAKTQANLLKIEFNIISIEPIFDILITQLHTIIKNIKQESIVTENLQARCRAIILLAISNKFNSLILTTSNKSEVAVGYSTLYGDTAGGFNVLKDISKTLVFKLAKYRNTISQVIPKSIINRKPSAELSNNQFDQDTLPPYNILDQIIKGYVEKDLSENELIKLRFDKKIVQKVISLINFYEYKRRQSPIGPKITTRSFGKDRRYPITSSFNNKNR
ncbi:NH(3)-dependent NAD(+) synthetase [Candidatus Providencia siddallii]|uniref:Glutamine-dependent NAD(+) synthetase n=1 Tax=Candidatus Providencia siddallii TaxID=1715285 RepID=A0A0M6WAN5_9GAMM|nr:NH(3)-dependent NAD(+) synthetase [Candidatus Providencia siddallii]